MKKTRFATTIAAAAFAVLCHGQETSAPQPAPAEGEQQAATNVLDLAGAPRLLGAEIERVAESPVPGTELRHNAVLIQKIADTPKKYPRKWGQMKKQPL